MSIVTISRQIGSLGQEIGRKVADQLGYRFIWRDLINQAAQRAGAPAMALAVLDELRLLGACATHQESQKYHMFVAEVMREIAGQGDAVILGRAGQCILAGFPNCLHVRIIAPEPVRARQIAKRYDIPLSAALEQVKTSDRYRKNYLQRFHQIRWDDPAHYDLTINSHHLSIAEAAAIICSAVEIKKEKVFDFQNHEEKRIE